MKYVEAGLLDDVVSVYDQTKTTIQGRCYQKTVDGKPALGPPINRFVDVQTEASMTMAANNMVMTSNEHLFVLSSEAGSTQIALWDIDFDTGVTTYRGKISISMPDTAATTTVYRAVKVIDDGTTGWKIFIATTGSVVINGGLLLVNNIDYADFTPVGVPSIPFATGDNQKAVYKLEDPANTGAGNLNTQSAGAVLNKAANRIYVHNGVAATHQYYVFDTSVSPTYVTASITGDQASNTINHTAHPYQNGDPVVFTALTGGAGFTVGTVYFVRNSATNTYELSATTGGAAINYTTDITDGTIGRAFGNCGSLFLHKTGNLPALTGVLLLTDSEDLAVPQHGGNSGQTCVFFCSTTNMYMGQLSELTSGATTWPSLETANLLGTANQIVAPTATNAAWSNSLDRGIISTGFTFIMKPLVNNQIDSIFGGTSNKYLEGFSYEAIELQPTAAVTAMDAESGWLGIVNLTIGQRGVILADILSDTLFDNSFLVTKVMDTPNAVLKFITTVDALFDYTGSLDIYYRTSGFGSISGGWTSIPFAELLDAFAAGQQIQLKVAFATLGLDTSIPAQLCDLFIGFETQTDSSDHWELSVDDSDNGNPSRSAFRLKKAFVSSVPTLYYRAYDLTNVQLVSHTTVANADRFEYSTNSGISWSALGTIPNTVGTLVRYTFSTPPGVDIRPSLKES